MYKILIFILLSLSAPAREVVYLVDTGYMGHKSCGSINVSKNVYPMHSHGRDMANIITKELPGDYCIKSYNVYDSKTNMLDLDAIISALVDISKQKPGIVNLSMQGESINITEKSLLYRLLDKGFTLHIASGNSKLDLDENCLSYPACYFTGEEKRVKIVSNYGIISNKNGPVNVMDHKYKEGTSESTAYITHLALKEVLNESKRNGGTKSVRWNQGTGRGPYRKNYTRCRGASKDCKAQRQAPSINEFSNESILGERSCPGTL